MKGCSTSLEGNELTSSKVQNDNVGDTSVDTGYLNTQILTGNDKEIGQHLTARLVQSSETKDHSKVDFYTSQV